jgi:hypothetical protein
MVLTYLERNRDRLGKAEIRYILAQRYGKTGSLAYAAGDLGFGLAALARAVIYGYPLSKVARQVLRPSGPMRWFKRWMGGCATST